MLNNPLRYIDPSGYSFWSIFKSIGRFFRRFWKPIVAIAVNVLTYGVATQWAASWGMTQGFSIGVLGTTQTFVTGLSVTGAMTAGAIAGAAGGFVAGALNTGSLSGAFRGALAGGLAGAAGAFANFGDVGGLGDAMKRIGASALGGCGAGVVSRSGCARGAKLAATTQALTMGASELYRRVSTKISQQTGQVYNSDGKPHLYQRGQSDVGSQLDSRSFDDWKNGLLKTEDISWSYDKSKFMKTVGAWPYMDAFAEFHDGLHDYAFIPNNQISLILTMPPSYTVTILSATQPYSSYYYINLIEERGKE